MRQFPPIANLNPSPPSHSLVLTIFPEPGAPPLVLQYGMKRFDKVAALGGRLSRHHSIQPSAGDFNLTGP